MVDRTQVKTVFLGALDVADSDRAAYVAEACADDDELASEVRSLLGHHDDAELIPEEPAPPADAAPAPQDELGLVGRTLDDRYRIDSFVAEGGFGYVYKGHHLGFDETIAIKVFKPLGDEALRGPLEDAFKKEAALLNRLSRKTTAIAQSYDIGRLDAAHGPSLLYTVIEWIEGSSLDETDAPEGGWTLPAILKLLAPIADALSVAHASGVAHRDVKPPNILVATSGVKLVDFGIAKIASDSQRGFMSTGGPLTAFSVDYAAPEQVNGDPTGPWTDVYAFALVIGELLRGSHPYSDFSAMKAMLSLSDPDNRPTPRASGVEVTDKVEAVFIRALVVDSKARFQDVAAFWSALTGAVD